MTKYHYNVDAFYNEDDVSFYLLGAFMTDGCVWRCSNGTSLATGLVSGDKDWLEAIRDLICKEAIIF